MSFADVNGYGFHHRNVIRIFNPAVVLCIGFKCARELRWAPAMDRIAHELACADKNGKDDEEEDCVDVTHTIDPVIGTARTELLK